jgi:glycine reductase
VQKLHPDVVICGPAFNYKDYAQMCAEITDSISLSTDVPAIASMSAENQEIIEKYKDRIYIVKCPKKGDVGLNSTLSNLCKAAKLLADNADSAGDIKQYCF